jgi:hypothetical protein
VFAVSFEQATFINLSGGSNAKLVYNEPEECPICKKAIKPLFLYGCINSARIDSGLYIVFQCRACKSAFIKSSQVGLTAKNYDLCENPINSYLSPNPPTPVKFSDYIVKISPTFVEIYNQANSAESYKLTQIAGIGYRKALEFLIKDYIISNLVEETAKEAIKLKPLAQCIKGHIELPQLKSVADRAVWLGNDEAHYTRKYEDKDIKDLKLCINVATHWIEMELTTKEINSSIKPIK